MPIFEYEQREIEYLKRRNVELVTKIEKLPKDMAVVEAVAGKNMTDIAILKAVKLRELMIALFFIYY